MNWANIATCSRIAMIPVVVALYLSDLPNNYWLAAGAFGLASITDWLDGFLARKLNQTSEFGAFLDPVADKLLVVAILVLLVSNYSSIWFLIPCTVIIMRELLVSALREWMATKGARNVVAVVFLGKLKTTAQMAALIALLATTPEETDLLWRLGYGLLYLSAFLSVWSLLDYFKAAKNAMNDT